tara:strand:+ start:4142 stop:4762 length:621 start_codon:yes stop_codon:yes gene_type:complete
VEQEKDLWKLVRQKLNKDQTVEQNLEEKAEPIIEDDFNETKENEITDMKLPEVVKIKETAELQDEKNVLQLMNEGIFAGFIYIFVIMIVLGILTLPGSITAAIGGFFGGKKAGDPARAMTAAMLPFLIIATLYFLAANGALPPGSGPNDVATEINDFMNNDIDDSALGPISKMPDSNSSVFISVVTFAFIGGLVQSEEKLKNPLKN